MKAKILLFKCLLGVSAMVSAQSVYIPDKVFKAGLLKRSTINTNGDTAISVAEAKATQEINFVRFIGPRGDSGPIITNITGIEKFTNLKTLHLENHYLQTANLAANTQLEKLYIYYEGSAPLDFSPNTKLKWVKCYLNQPELDLSALTSLQHLDCTYSDLEKLNVSQSSDLRYLNMSINKFTLLDVTHNPLLDTLIAEENLLTTLDLSFNDQMKVLNISKNKFSSVDVSKLDQLQRLECFENKLNTLDLSKNMQLKSVVAYNNKLSAINFQKPNKVKILDLDRNEFTSFDISNIDLDFLSVESNPALKTICVKSIVSAQRTTIHKDLQANFVVCADSAQQACKPHIGASSGCEDFKDADPAYEGINEYAVKTDKTKWENGAAVLGENAYMGMFWTEGSKDNGFSAVKQRLGNGSLQYTINQPYEAYEPVMLTFGSYAENDQEQKFTLDLSNNALVAFDVIHRSLDDIDFYVELEDIHGHNLALDKTYDTTGNYWYDSHIGYQVDPYINFYWSQRLDSGNTVNHFEYDFKDAVCAEKVVEENGTILKARPDIAFNYSKVKLVKLFVTSDPYDLYDYTFDLKNFRMGGDSPLVSVTDRVTATTDENYTAYDLLGNYVDQGKESALQLKAGQIYILKSKDKVKKKFIIE